MTSSASYPSPLPRSDTGTVSARSPWQMVKLSGWWKPRGSSIRPSVPMIVALLRWSPTMLLARYATAPFG